MCACAKSVSFCASVKYLGKRTYMHGLRQEIYKIYKKKKKKREGGEREGIRWTHKWHEHVSERGRRDRRGREKTMTDRSSTFDDKQIQDKSPSPPPKSLLR